MSVAPISRFSAVVPAAGSGRRLGGPLPKQYQPLLGRPVIEHTLRWLLALPGLERLVLVVAAQDSHWRSLPADVLDPARVQVVTGGAERCHSVLSGLEALSSHCAPSDWVLVHDAARPCCPRSDVERLLAAVATHPVGGLLGSVVAETVKRVDVEGVVTATVDRSELRLAQTPQLFRFRLLHDALAEQLAAGQRLTDEAAALEAAGHRPLLVEGSRRNLKITLPGDLELAAWYLGHEEASP